METVTRSLSRSINYLSFMSLSDFLDIIIVAYLLYRVIGFIRRTNSNNIANGLVVILVVMGLSELFNLTMINFILRKAVELGLIALLILFQPELRRLLERVGSGFNNGKHASGNQIDTAISQTVQACREMAESRTGALIVFERSVALNNIMLTGTTVNADVNAEVMKNLFFDKAPLHDGAVIIRDCRIAAAGCVLPVTQSTNLAKELGMRHRAGIALSEESDAVIIIVSEERGSISVAMDGKLKRHQSPDALEQLLKKELVADNDNIARHSMLDNIKKLFLMNSDK